MLSRRPENAQPLRILTGVLSLMKLHAIDAPADESMCLAFVVFLKNGGVLVRQIVTRLDMTSVTLLP